MCVGIGVGADVGNHIDINVPTSTGASTHGVGGYRDHVGMEILVLLRGYSIDESNLIWSSDIS
jgi:hypothetical protein